MHKYPLQQSLLLLQLSPTWLHLSHIPLTQFIPWQHSEVSRQLLPSSLHVAQVPEEIRHIRGGSFPPQQSWFVRHPLCPSLKQHTPLEQEPEQHSSSPVQLLPSALQSSHLPPMQRRLPQQSSLVWQL
ncbi:MAG: hypothetical protein QXT25_02455 [Candidatus Anstonellaceae archaeon]